MNDKPPYGPPRTDHYPIRRRREKRRLDPNWLGIAWLEAGLDADTETVRVTELREGTSTLVVVGELHTAAGATTARRRGNYPRPMIGLVADGTSSGMMRRYPDPCPSCDQWQYTLPCADHPERSVTEPNPAPFEIPGHEALRLAFRRALGNQVQVTWRVDGS